VQNEMMASKLAMLRQAGYKRFLRARFLMLMTWL